MQNNSCTLVVLKIKTVQHPGFWLVRPHSLSYHLSKLSLLSLGSQKVLFGPLLSQVLVFHWKPSRGQSEWLEG